MAIKVAAFSGSLRKASYTTKLLKAFQHLSPKDVEVTIIDIGQLPLMNEDLEDNVPQSVKDLHRSLKNADAILLASPEYNRSYSPVIKNALDWGSRAGGKNGWAGKPAGVIGCTQFQLGAFGAVHHLRQVLTYLDMPTMQQPEFYLGGAADKFNNDGELTDKETVDHIKAFWKSFKGWINKLS